MTHFMSLRPSPFSKIASGEKTFELRLYDEKRQLIKVGDFIEFTCTDNDTRQLTVRVKALHRFCDFAQLYASLPLEKCGYRDASKADPGDMDAYYPREKQAEYGVVGIEIELV